MNWIDHQLPSDPQALRALLIEQRASHVAELKARDTAIQRRDVEIEQLREKLNALLASRYGASSEQIPDEQLRLFNEAEVDAEVIVDDAEAGIEVPAHRRRRGGRRALPEQLPRVDIHYELDDAERVCPHDATMLERVSEVITEQLDVIPARLQVVRHIRGTYACPCCRKTMKTASLPAQPIPKSQAAPGMLAHIAASKYVDGLPLYRQAAMWERVGVELARGTLASWMIRCGALAQPLINLLRERLLDTGLVQCDETTVQVLKEPGRTAQSSSYMWVQLSLEPGIVLFEYAPSRAGVIPRALFEGFTGTLHITLAGCWAHVRRRFNRVFKAAGVNPKKSWPKGQSPPAKLRQAAKGLGYIQTLFAIERRIRDKPPDERRRVRQGESRPVLDKLRAWLNNTTPKVPPTSALGEALGFLERQWPKLTVFLDDGRVELSTNRVENAIRPFVIGRKAWLFSDTVAGAKASANLYSLVETAKANHLNPYLYLKHVFTELPKANTVEHIEALLPENCDREALLELAAWR
jgi:transposase